MTWGIGVVSASVAILDMCYVLQAQVLLYKPEHLSLILASVMGMTPKYTTKLRREGCKPIKRYYHYLRQVILIARLLSPCCRVFNHGTTLRKSSDVTIDSTQTHLRLGTHKVHTTFVNWCKTKLSDFNHKKPRLKTSPVTMIIICLSVGQLQTWSSLATSCLLSGNPVFQPLECISSRGTSQWSFRIVLGETCVHCNNYLSRN